MGLCNSVHPSPVCISKLAFPSQTAILSGSGATRPFGSGPDAAWWSGKFSGGTACGAGYGGALMYHATVCTAAYPKVNEAPHPQKLPAALAKNQGSSEHTKGLKFCLDIDFNSERATPASIM